ncbi:unnamed protein product [Prorocentrum cordatum]|uniref:EF-hand domain-containing protein n=1 Tax=Prorocentrum cordatum TaxID=2364126 RepID=A0ABN9UUW4_9DINO|nr:unnamed protein product [Polarella glacialis]
MAAVEYAKPSCETDEEIQDRLGADGAAPEVSSKRTSPAWRVLATVVGGVLLLAAVVGATARRPTFAMVPHRDNVLRAQTRRSTRLNKVFALHMDPGFPKMVSLQEAGDGHSIQDDVAGEEAAAGGGDGGMAPPFADIDGDGDGLMTFQELQDFLLALPGVTQEMWDEQQSYVKEDFESADVNSDGGLDEEEFVAATQPGAKCASHDECDDEFCYAGHCASCDDCHYCWDGIDGTCGSCGDGFPTKEDDACEIDG